MKRVSARVSIKLSKKFWLVLGIGVLVLLAAILWFLRTQQVAEQKRLNDELAMVNSRLAGLGLDQLSAQQTQLRNQIAAANAQVQDLYGKIGSPTDSIAVSNTLYGIAKECDVAITGIQAGADQTTELAGVSCHYTTLDVIAEGDWSKLIEFVSSLKSDFTDCLVQSATFTAGDTTLQTPPSVNLTLNVYTLGGEVQ